MAKKTLKRVSYLLDAPFKELWARKKIKDCKELLKLYKHSLNKNKMLAVELKKAHLEEIRVIKYEIEAWRSLIPRYQVPFSDDDWDMK